MVAKTEQKSQFKTVPHTISDFEHAAEQMESAANEIEIFAHRVPDFIPMHCGLLQLFGERLNTQTILVFVAIKP